MHQFHIDNMTKNVLAALDLDGLSYNKVREAISKEWQDTIALTWCVEDVIYAAKEKEQYIDWQAAKNLLWTVYHRHDASLGVSWLTLEVYLDDFAGICPECGGPVDILGNGDAKCEDCDYTEEGWLDERYR